MATGTQTTEQIRQRYAAQLADIRGRKDLSDDGRRRQIAKARMTAAAAMRKARDKQATERDAREQELLGTLFGNRSSGDATSVISFRDAQDRAARLKQAEEATELLARARRSGDHLLAKAIGMRALDMVIGHPLATSGWGAVLDQWAGDEPSVVDKALTELGEIHRERSRAANLRRSVHNALENPPELRGHNINQLAAQADKNPDEDEPPDPLAGFGWGRGGTPEIG